MYSFLMFRTGLTGKQIDEIAFGEYLLRKKERKCIHGKLYDLDGEISDEVIRKERFLMRSGPIRKPMWQRWWIGSWVH